MNHPCPTCCVPALHNYSNRKAAVTFQMEELEVRFTECFCSVDELNIWGPHNYSSSSPSNWPNNSSEQETEEQTVISHQRSVEMNYVLFQQTVGLDEETNYTCSIMWQYHIYHILSFRPCHRKRKQTTAEAKTNKNMTDGLKKSWQISSGEKLREISRKWAVQHCQGGSD